MSSPRDTLVGYLGDDRPYTRTRAELEPLWLAAANERLRQQRARIPVLGRLADERGVDEIRTLGDLIPLLFAHSNYKSYPDAFLSKGRWDLMNRWLDTLSAERVEGVDVEGIADQDEWIERLHAAGHMVFATSGTSGKNSFLPATPFDREFSMQALLPIITWVQGIQPRQDRAVFILGPKYAPNRVALYFRELAERFGQPDARFFLTDEPMKVSEISRMAAIRRAIAAGTAKPSEIADFEREAKERQADMAHRLDALIDVLLEHRREPMIIGGFWAQYWMIVERARARGVSAGEFHPETVITGGGGTKGANLPDDYEAQILDFFGLTRANVQLGYGMSELSAGCPMVDDRYRPMPWVIPLILDDAGEVLLNADANSGEGGLVEGRFAFFDVSIEGRWGGVVTGDRVVADFSTPNVSIVHGSVVRYSELEGGDDKLTCAGTVDAYVRGVMQ
jgi:hypothetical protein